MEAMDESAEWRMKYDGEVERNKQVQDELQKVHPLFVLTLVTLLHLLLIVESDIWTIAV